MRRLIIHLTLLGLMAGCCGGCASSYQAYGCSRPSCNYVAPAALGYRPADPCLCPDSAGQQFASRLRAQRGPVADSGQ